MPNELVLSTESEPSKFILKFRFKYDYHQLRWFQLIQKIIGYPSKLVFLYENRVLIFLDPTNFLDANKRFIEFSEFFTVKSNFHIRLIPFYEDFEELIRNWFYNLRDKVQVHIQFSKEDLHYEIEIGAPRNVHQFIYGQNRREIKMLTAFLEQSVEGKHKFNFRIV